GDPPRFDACLASGVLYHMTSPVELIALLARTTDRVCLWTHYYDANIISRSHRLARLFSIQLPGEHEGYRHTLYHRGYKEALGWGGFCGAGQTHSHWMGRDEILAALRHFGLTRIAIAFDEPQHVNGPAFALVACRT